MIPEHVFAIETKDGKRQGSVIPLAAIMSVHKFPSHMPPEGIEHARKGGTVLRFTLALNGAAFVQEITIHDEDTAVEIYIDLIDRLENYWGKR